MPDVIGPWRGPRQEGVDYFDDVLTDNSPGIFAGSDGAEDYDRIKTKKTAEGVDVDVHCRFCNRGCVITLYWPELYVVQFVAQTDLLPKDWKKGEENMLPYPDARCSCGSGPNNGLISIFIAPDWAEKEITSALRSNLISQQWLMNQPMVRAFEEQPIVQQFRQRQGYR